jgi:WD40 repeat protein
MLKHRLLGYSSKVLCVAVSDDSKSVWCTDSGRHVHTLVGHMRSVWCLEFRGHNVLISGDSDSVIKVWELRNGKVPSVLHTLKAHARTVWVVKVSPDGMKIANGSGNKTVMVWSVVSGELLLTFKGHTDSISCVAWSSDSRLVASRGSDKKILVGC